MITSPETSYEIFEPIIFNQDQGLLHLYNPTNKDAQEHANHLAKTGQKEWPAKGPILIRPTEKSVEDTAELLIEESINSGPLHISLSGGDGTTRNGLEAVRKSGIDSVVALVALGNANDMASSINRNSYRLDPIHTLLNGSKKYIRPIDIQISSEGNEEIAQTSAYGYTGIGISGIVARFIDSKEYRARRSSHKTIRLFHEILATNKFVNSAQSFILDDHTTEPRSAVEYVLLHSGRMAKMKFGPYSRIFRDTATIAEINTKTKKDISKAIGSVILAKNTLSYGDNLSISVNYEGSDLILQTDGEPMPVASGSNLNFRFSDQRVAVAQTRI